MHTSNASSKSSSTERAFSTTICLTGRFSTFSKSGLVSHRSGRLPPIITKIETKSANRLLQRERIGNEAVLEGMKLLLRTVLVPDNLHDQRDIRARRAGVSSISPHQDHKVVPISQQDTAPGLLENKV
jgi:hypothetical protein